MYPLPAIPWQSPFPFLIMPNCHKFNPNLLAISRHYTLFSLSHLISLTVELYKEGSHSAAKHNKGIAPGAP
jgi:hypothetical protein